MEANVKRRVKSFVTSVLVRLGLYQRIKQSIIYDLYWSIADRKLLIERSAEVDFYRQILKGLKGGDIIFDIGANRGHKTDIFLRLGATVIAVDPDRVNQEILNQRFLNLRMLRRPVTVVPKAAGASVRPEVMWIDEPGSAKNTLSPKWVDTLRANDSRFGRKLDFSVQKVVEMTTLDMLIEEFGIPFFIKIDVEGYEALVLAGLHRSVPFLSFEVNLPEFLSEGIKCVDALSRLSKGGTFNYVSSCSLKLLSEHWFGSDECVAVLKSCRESSIEVLWRSG